LENSLAAWRAGRPDAAALSTRRQRTRSDLGGTSGSAAKTLVVLLDGLGEVDAGLGAVEVMNTDWADSSRVHQHDLRGTMGTRTAPDRYSASPIQRDRHRVFRCADGRDRSATTEVLNELKRTCAKHADDAGGADTLEGFHSRGRCRSVARGRKRGDVSRELLSTICPLDSFRPRGAHQCLTTEQRRPWRRNTFRRRDDVLRWRTARRSKRYKEN